jgi:hypothetical protein
MLQVLRWIFSMACLGMLIYMSYTHLAQGRPVQSAFAVALSVLLIAWWIYVARRRRGGEDSQR